MCVWLPIPVLWGITYRVFSHHGLGDDRQDLLLQDKRHVPAAALSGGMKRKLSAGIAFIGGSKARTLQY